MTPSRRGKARRFCHRRCRNSFLTAARRLGIKTLNKRKRAREDRLIFRLDSLAPYERQRVFLSVVRSLNQPNRLRVNPVRL